MAFPLAALASFAGPAAAGALSFFGQKQANEENKQQSLQQMQFQERMSSTAYQRAVSDMKLSGINPMLAYMQGGASSPGGAQARIEDQVGPAVASAQHARRLSGELAMMDSQRNLADANAAKARTETVSQNLHTLAATRLIEEDMLGRPIQRSLWSTDLERGRLENIGLRNRAAVESGRLGPALSYIDRIRQSIFGGSGLGASYMPGARIGRFSIGR